MKEIWEKRRVEAAEKRRDVWKLKKLFNRGFWNERLNNLACISEKRCVGEESVERENFWRRFWV